MGGVAWQVRGLAAAVLAASAAAGVRGGIVVTEGNTQFAPKAAPAPAGLVGDVHALAFAGERLLAGGHGKAVRSFAYAEQGRRWRPTATYRWPIARGVRGHVYALAAAPGRNLVALAGYSAYNATGDVVVHDTRRGVVVAALIGHLQTVSDLRFGPDGTRLLSCSLDGEVRLWDVPERDAMPWPGRVLRAGDPAAADGARCLGAFLGDGRVVVTARTEDAGQPLEVRGFDGGPVRIVPAATHPRGVRALDARGDLLATAGGDGQVRVFDPLAAVPPRTLARPQSVRDVRWLSADRVAYSTAPYRRGDGVLAPATVQVAAVAAAGLRIVDGRPLAPTARGPTDRYPLAVAAAAERLAVFDDAAGALLSFDLSAAAQDGRPPLAAAAAVTVATRTPAATRLAFSRDGGRLGVAAADAAEGTYPTAFDFAGWRLWRDAADPAGQTPWHEPPPTGWTLAADASGTTLTLASPDGAAGTVRLDPVRQGPATAHRWLPRGARTPLLAVATGYPGCGVFVYAPAGPGDWTPVRSFRDHGDAVTALAIHPTAAVLASGSADGTVKLWSLAGLAELPTPAPADAIAAVRWGGAVTAADGATRLASVVPHGIFAARGLRERDRLAAVTVPVLDDAGAWTGRQDRLEGAAVAGALAGQALTQPVTLEIRRGGYALNERIHLTPAWEPLATLLSDARGEWVAYTPGGLYEASADGDAIFGFQRNRGLDETPDYLAAAQLRGRLERPGRLRGLLRDAGLAVAPVAPVADAAAAADDAAAAPAGDALRAAVAEAPRVRIVAPADGAAVAGDSIELVAEVTYPEGAGAAAARAFVNGVPGELVADERRGGTATYRWQARSPDRFNRLRVVVPADAAEDAVFGAADVNVRLADPSAEPGRLHVVALAVQDYRGDMALSYSRADADGLVARLHAAAPPLYRPGVTAVLRDDRIRRATVPAFLEDATGRIGRPAPQDVVVLFVAGHGIAFGGDYYLIPSHFPPGGGAAWVREHGIPWSDLAALAELRCRKVFLVDTCFAGNILLAGAAADSWKRPARDLAARQVFVLSATSVGQEALEDRRSGHGVFTQALLTALAGAAEDRRDGVVDVAELFGFVAGQVPRVTGGRQTPTAMPRDLLDSVWLPVVPSGP